jgi:uncharacterized protein
VKYLLAFLIVLLVAWRWRTARAAQRGGEPHNPSSATNGPVEMVRCGHCGVHLPASEAVAGSKGRYCSLAHQRKTEP